MSKDRREAPLHALFEEQARRTPQAPALVDGHGALSYEELDRQAEHLASYLHSEGVRLDSVVGVYMEHNAAYVVACLAALKAGGAFLPLELAYPDSLLEDVLADSEPRVVLTQEKYADRLPDAQRRFCLDEGWKERLPKVSFSESPPEPGPDNLCFVAYSSGTTGKPKGIANPHRAAVGSYLWRFGISDYRPGDRVGCNVFFIWEVFRPLLRGATSYVIPDDVIYDPAALIRYLEENEITETLMTPSLLEAVLVEGDSDLEERLASLKTLWLNGEVVTRTLAKSALAALPETRLMNVYSISETHEVAAGDLRELSENPDSTYCPVGRPMDPERLYILDEDMEPVPEGEAGELYVGGDLLARGYVRREELTRERFIEDPFSEEEGARVYRSGDRARPLSDGTLEILGRCDSMQKIRGYSVELGAVEAAIEEHLAVRNCVADVEGEEGEDKRLVAYLVPADPAEYEGRYADWSLDPQTGRSPDIRDLLRERLPHYMIPSVFVELASVPLQETTGKVDRRKLPPPPARTGSGAPEDLGSLPADAPRGEKERLLVRIWESVLELGEGEVRPEDDFFEIGGHSLAAAELMGRVEDAFGVRLPVSAFLEGPTVAELLDRIEARQKGTGDRKRADRKPDLHSEAVLDAGISPESTGGTLPLREARSIFLTGATGFLGAFLLDTLLSRTDATIYCLVRRKPEQKDDPLAPIKHNLEQYGLWDAELARRIVPVSGDLEKPLLGLAGDEFDALAREIDVIFHAAAMVNLLYPYESLKGPNVIGTREVLRLACCHRTKPVNHVSTNGIFPPGRRLCTEDADFDSLAGAREDGYGQSKWVAESMVRQAAERGLPVRIYRPGNISGHSESGASNARDFTTALMVGTLRLGRAPEMSGWRLEMTPVDFVAGAILHLAGNPEAEGGTFHLANPDRVPAHEFFGWIENFGYSLDQLHYSEWLKAWRQAPREEKDAIGSILHGAGPETYEIWDDNTYDDRNTRRALRRSGLQRPEIDANLLESYVRYFVEQGWVEAPSKVPA